MILSFKKDNAAFQEDSLAETARILKEIAGKIEKGESYGMVWDVNGNVIGEWDAYKQ